MNRTIGVVAALPAEAKALSGRRCGGKTDGFRYCRTMLSGNIHLLVVQSGMGLDNARAAAAWILRQGPAALGCFGVSGGLSPDVGLGDLVFADAVMEETVPLTYERACCDSVIPLTASLVEPVNFHRGAILTVKEPVFQSAQKRRLFDRTGALAVDMESAAVARAAQEAKVPFFALRSICDPEAVSIPEAFYECIDRRGRPLAGVLVRMILRNPRMIFLLIQMKRNVDAALARGPDVLKVLRGMRIP